MLVNGKSTEGTATKNVTDTRVKAEKQEVITAVAKAGKKYGKMLSRLSK
ncbi:hypothetical protein SCACP_25100 [Sporomusa carbonis]